MPAFLAPWRGAASVKFDAAVLSVIPLFVYAKLVARDHLHGVNVVSSSLNVGLDAVVESVAEPTAVKDL